VTVVASASLTVRLLRHDELPQLAAAISDELSLAQLENRWREQEAGYRTLIVAEVEGRAVGTVSLYSRNGRAAAIHLFALEVGQEWRNRGIGTALIDHVISEAREGGHTSVFLEVRADNSGARRLYHRLGFRRVGPEFVNTWWRFKDDGTRDAVDEVSVRMVKRVGSNKSQATSN
jgi:ribosomal protein S18 acetylase RimI-like enzyme